MKNFVTIFYRRGAEITEKNPKNTVLRVLCASAVKNHAAPLGRMALWQNNTC